MPTYRAYFIDGDDRVAFYKPIEAETDAEALKAARQFSTAVMSRSGCLTGRSGGSSARKSK